MSDSLTLPRPRLDPQLRLARRIAGPARFEALVAMRHPQREAAQASRGDAGAESKPDDATEEAAGEELAEEEEEEEAAGEDDLYGDDLYGDLGKDDVPNEAAEEDHEEEDNKDEGLAGSGQALQGQGSAVVFVEAPVEYFLQDPSLARQRLLSKSSLGKSFSSMFLETRGTAASFQFAQGV